MDELRELPEVRQVPGEPRRRWFNSPELDLIVWLDDDDRPSGFQLCYAKRRGERALTWRAGRGYDHAAVDDGESMPTKYKGTPILVADGLFQSDKVKADFLEASGAIPESIRRFVADVLERYPRG
jgi:hypothetical protein